MRNSRCAHATTRACAPTVARLARGALRVLPGPAGRTTRSADTVHARRPSARTAPISGTSSACVPTISTVNAPTNLIEDYTLVNARHIWDADPEHRTISFSTDQNFADLVVLEHEGHANRHSRGLARPDTAHVHRDQGRLDPVRARGTAGAEEEPRRDAQDQTQGRSPAV